MKKHNKNNIKKKKTKREGKTMFILFFNERILIVNFKPLWIETKKNIQM